MGRPKKSTVSIEAEIDQAAGLSVSRETSVAVIEEPKKEVKKLAVNEFTDEYTLQVDTDFDPSADLFRVPKKDPNFEYRFIRDTSERLSVTGTTLLHQKGGWQVVPKAHLLKVGIAEREISEDGHLRRGNLILCFMPMNHFKLKADWKNKQVNQRTAGIKRLVEDGIDVIGANGSRRNMRDKSQKDNDYETPQ